MAVVFLEGGLSPIPMRMANTKLHRGPHRGVCQFRCRTQGLTKSIKRNSLVNLAFLASFGTHAIGISLENNYQKNNNDDSKTNKLAGAVKGRGRTILRSELHILLTEGVLRDTARPPQAGGAVVGPCSNGDRVRGLGS